MQLNGLHTLRLKETDRIKALHDELKKIGVDAKESGDSSLELNYPKEKNSQDDIFTPELLFKTYQDHRMAMAFAPLALIYPEIKIENPAVVKKSYPDFWNDLRIMGFEIKEEQ
jgi:3-phosphoshikimate 1-carboxyvinyltransferase